MKKRQNMTTLTVLQSKSQKNYWKYLDLRYSKIAISQFDSYKTGVFQSVKLDSFEVWNNGKKRQNITIDNTTASNKRTLLQLVNTDNSRVSKFKTKEHNLV